jgi:hypothetical protein
MRALAYRRGLGISGMLLLLMALLLALTSTPAAGIVDPPGTVHVKTSSLTDHDCDFTEWHFVITQIDEAANAPASITVKFSGGATVVVALEKFTGGVAHYTTTQHLGETVIDATAILYVGWSGEFNLSHGPCAPTTTTTIGSSTTGGATTTTTIGSSITAGPTTTIGSSTTAGGSTTTTTIGSSTTAGPTTTTTIGSSTTAGGSTTTTTIGSSTTAGGSTTTTTIGSSTTAGGSTTTTTIGSSTTAAPTTTQGGGTTPAPTTSTTLGSITTQGAGPTTSGGGANGSGPSSVSTATVLGIQVTAPVVGQVTQVTLPFTGLPAESMAVWAASLALLGLLLLAASRRQTERIPGRSWE